MKNSNVTSNLQHPATSSAWADWLVMHRKTASLITACIIVLVVGLVWSMQKQKAREIKDFETADVLAEELQKNPVLFESDQASSPNKALDELRALTDNYRILQSRFDSLIAEEEMLLNDEKQIDPYAERAIGRMKNIGLADFADFSEVSRLSSLHKYNEALVQATSLKNRLKAHASSSNTSEELPGGSITSREFLLEGFLLLHIAALNQRLGQFENMLQSIVELKEFLGLSPRPRRLTRHEKELAASLLSHLQERQSSLLDFLELPEKHVNP